MKKNSVTEDKAEKEIGCGGLRCFFFSVNSTEETGVDNNCLIDIT